MLRVDCSRLRFLIADDNSYSRRVIRAQLYGFGAREVFEADDGGAALESFSVNLPDVVILDWSMPVLDGIEVTRMLRSPDQGQNPYVPIILVTAYAERARIFEAREAGVSEMLVKPFSTKGLYMRLAKVILNPRPFIEVDGHFVPDRRHLVQENQYARRGYAQIRSA